MAPVPRIQVTSRSWVKPVTPTPFHKEHTKLSDWDFVMYTSYIPILLFYTNDNNDPKFMNTDALKDSLSKTLDDFYPLAGRLLDIGNGKDIIDNCDDGVLFVEAEYSRDLETFRQEGYLPSQMDYHKMLPIHFYCSSQDPLLAIQVTRFTDGGVSLGVMILHKVADMHSACYFLNAWSKATRGIEFTPASFNRDLINFPKDTIITDEVLDHYRDEHRVCQPNPSQLEQYDPYQLKFNRSGAKGPKPLKSIVLEFYSSGLQACKKDAHTPEMIASKNWISTKDALLAMLLRAMVRSRAVSEEADVKMVMTLNGRSRMKNHKQMEYYFGNWMICRAFKTNFKEINQTPLVNTAMKLRQTITSLRPSLFHGISKLYKLHDDMTANYLTYQPNSEFQTTINDVSTLPFYKVDFGFGCPDRTRSYITFGGNGCLFVFNREDNSEVVYDVQLQMDLASISRFIEDPDIQKYANNIRY